MNYKILFQVALLVSISVSCSKTKTGPTPTTKTPQEYLLNKTWVFQHLVYVQNNTLGKYNRGGSSTIDLGKDAILFKSDGTGVYTNNDSEVFNITWQFTDNSETGMNYMIADYANGHPSPGSNLTLTLENINVNDHSFKYAEIYTSLGGNSTISSVERVPQ